MNLARYDWILVVDGILVLALIIFATVYSVRARRFEVKKKKKAKSKK